MPLPWTMNQTLLTSMLPALGLLLFMALLAWGVHWLRRRMMPSGSGLGADLRLVSQLMVGPQQRVVVIEVNGPAGPVQLTLGVTAQHISALHTQALTSAAAEGAAAFGSELRAELRADASANAAPGPQPGPAGAQRAQATPSLYQKIARSLAAPKQEPRP